MCEAGLPRLNVVSTCLSLLLIKKELFYEYDCVLVRTGAVCSDNSRWSARYKAAIQEHAVHTYQCKPGLWSVSGCSVKV